jgi:hypothetical protein
MSDIAIQSSGTARGKVLVGGLVLVVAVGLFAAAFIYAGGVGIVSKLMGGAGAVQTASAPTPPAQAPAKPPVVPATVAAAPAEDFGKRMYAEQLESAANIKKLASGDIKSFAVTKVEKNAAGTGAAVYITATFGDGRSGPGTITLRQDGTDWYVLTIEGMRLPGATEEVSVDVLEPDWSIDWKRPLEEVMASAGVKTFDQGVVDTLLAEQKANQEVTKAIMDGTFNACTLGKPVKGAGTIAIPVDLAGKQTAKAQVTIITKKIDGRDRLFITGFKKQ